MHSQAHDVSAPSLLETLRTGTGLLHVALEQRLPFFSERLDAQWYRRLLQAYYGFYQPMEAALYDSGLIPDGYESALRVKTPTLVHDLHALGLTDHAVHALPRCPQLPALDTPAACLGALYVLEGATLGESSEDKMGVVVLKVEPGSGAWRSGLREQDVILSINRVRIQSLEDVENAVARNASGLLLNIRRGNSALFLVIR